MTTELKPDAQQPTRPSNEPTSTEPPARGARGARGARSEPRWPPVPPASSIWGEIGWAVVNLVQLCWLGVFSLLLWPVGIFMYAVTWNPDTALSLARTFYGPINVFLGFSSVVVEGAENFPKKKPFLLLMNHQSMADIMVAWMICPHAVRFIAKRVLTLIPIVGWTMLLFDMVWIDRENVRNAMRSLKRAANVLKRERVVCAFPEGTRTRDGKIGPFKKGVFLLALKSGVTIVPVAIEGAAVFVPRTGWRPRPVTIRAKVGTPIDPNAFGEERRDELMQVVRDAMIDMHLSIGGRGGDRDARGARTASTPRPRDGSPTDVDPLPQLPDDLDAALRSSGAP